MTVTEANALVGFRCRHKHFSAVLVITGQVALSGQQPEKNVGHDSDGEHNHRNKKGTEGLYHH